MCLNMQPLDTNPLRIFELTYVVPDPLERGVGIVNMYCVMDPTRLSAQAIVVVFGAAVGNSSLVLMTVLRSGELHPLPWPCSLCQR